MCFNSQEGFEGQMTEDNIEIGICNEGGFRYHCHVVMDMSLNIHYLLRILGV